VVEGEEVLSCSFCNEVFHEREACLGREYFPIKPYECEWEGQSEWCCPKCFEGAKTKHLRRFYSDAHFQTGPGDEDDCVDDDGGWFYSGVDVGTDRYPSTVHHALYSLYSLHSQYTVEVDANGRRVGGGGGGNSCPRRTEHSKKHDIPVGMLPSDTYAMRLARARAEEREGRGGASGEGTGGEGGEGGKDSEGVLTETKEAKDVEAKDGAASHESPTSMEIDCQDLPPVDYGLVHRALDRIKVGVKLYTLLTVHHSLYTTHCIHYALYALRTVHTTHRIHHSLYTLLAVYTTHCIHHSL
jgi:hypothetical protein